MKDKKWKSRISKINIKGLINKAYKSLVILLTVAEALLV
jgi:hypothetical protein